MSLQKATKNLVHLSKASKHDEKTVLMKDFNMERKRNKTLNHYIHTIGPLVEMSFRTRHLYRRFNED